MDAVMAEPYYGYRCQECLRAHDVFASCAEAASKDGHKVSDAWAAFFSPSGYTPASIVEARAFLAELDAHYAPLRSDMPHSAVGTQRTQMNRRVADAVNALKVWIAREIKHGEA